jgi:alpha-L-rhamnosidase
MMNKTYFLTANPVWPQISNEEMNYIIGFRAILKTSALKTTYLNVTAATFYRVCINGDFVAYGPARAAKGHFRVDSIDITDKLCNPTNIVTIEVGVYNTQTSYIMEQDPFVQAEIVSEDHILASTLGEGSSFKAYHLTDRVQKTPRYSLQRGFLEYYKQSTSTYSWKTDSNAALEELPLNILEAKTLLNRSVDYPLYEIKTPEILIKEEQFFVDNEKEATWRPIFTRMVGKITKGFEDPTLEVNPVEILNKITPSKTTLLNESLYNAHSFSFLPHTSMLFEFSKNHSGFIGAKIEVVEDSVLYFVFDEVLTNGDVDIKRAQVNTILAYELKKGTYQLESLEVYTLKYLKVIQFKGKCRIQQLYLREYANPLTEKALFECNRQELNALFHAGVETYRQNAVDLFTDCPSRERAGYLCDSYFIARAAYRLSGNTKVEDNFLENYLMAKNFDRLPEGMIPMCYPADVKVNYRDLSSPYGMYIPNWSLWLIIELNDYTKRNPSSPLITRFKSRILGIIQFFEAYLNEEGLLEDLPGWVFIEWSKANDYVQGVNYPSNMLFAAALEIVGNLYGVDKYLKQSEQIKQTISAQSFDGNFFVDHALRVEGTLQPTQNKSEVCQYYAFFFGLATQETHQNLWSTLINHFGPIRKTTNAYPEVAYANAFIGNFLRLDLLSNAGLVEQWLKETTSYFNHMIELTGTLWEHDDVEASCNHGFGSYVVHWIYKNIVGLEDIDCINKKIILCFREHAVTDYQAKIPFENEWIEVTVKKNALLHCTLQLPKGYTAEIINHTSLELHVK